MLLPYGIGGGYFGKKIFSYLIFDYSWSINLLNEIFSATAKMNCSLWSSFIVIISNLFIIIKSGGADVSNGGGTGGNKKRGF